MVVLHEAHLPPHPGIKGGLVVRLEEAATVVGVDHGLVDPYLVVDIMSGGRLRRDEKTDSDSRATTSAGRRDEATCLELASSVSLSPP